MIIVADPNGLKLSCFKSYKSALRLITRCSFIDSERLKWIIYYNDGLFRYKISNKKKKKKKNSSLFD